MSFKIIMTKSVTRPCFTTQHQTCKTKTKTIVYKTKTEIDFFWSQTGLVLRPTVSDHVTDHILKSFFVVLYIFLYHCPSLLCSQRPSSNAKEERQIHQ